MPRTAQAWYFGLFALQFGIGAYLLLVRAAYESKNLSDYAVNWWSYAAPLAIASAATSLVVVEIWGLASALCLLFGRSLMVLGEYLKDKFNLRRKDREPRPSSERPTQDLSADRPPQAFPTSPPGRIEPKEPSG